MLFASVPDPQAVNSAAVMTIPVSGKAFRWRVLAIHNFRSFANIYRAIGCPHGQLLVDKVKFGKGVDWVVSFL